MANAKMYTFLEKNIGSFPGLHKLTQKKEKGGMANAKMYTFLEKNIGAFPGLHK